jgi:hypothetical protein
VNGLCSVASDSFTEHFCRDEDENGSAKTTSEKQIDQGIACGGEYGLDYQCNHRLMNWESCNRLAAVAGPLFFLHQSFCPFTAGINGAHTPAQISRLLIRTVFS